MTPSDLSRLGQASKEAMEEALRANPHAARFCGRQDLSTPEQIEEIRQWDRRLWHLGRLGAGEPKA